jgi:P27 family predicted phage terminase small subunit
MSRKLGSKLETTKQATLLTAEMPEKPTGLSAGAARQWDRLVDEMDRSGIVLIPAYRAAIVQAATLQADLAVAWEIIKRDGRYTTSKTGVMKTHPAVDDTMRLNEKLSRALWQLGLTPRSRSNADTKVEPEQMSAADQEVSDMLDDSIRQASGR